MVTCAIWINKQQKYQKSTEPATSAKCELIDEPTSLTRRPPRRHTTSHSLDDARFLCGFGVKALLRSGEDLRKLKRGALWAACRKIVTKFSSSFMMNRNQPHNTNWNVHTKVVFREIRMHFKLKLVLERHGAPQTVIIIKKSPSNLNSTVVFYGQAACLGKIKKNRWTSLEVTPFRRYRSTKSKEISDI